VKRSLLVLLLLACFALPALAQTPAPAPLPTFTVLSGTATRDGVTHRIVGNFSIGYGKDVSEKQRAYAVATFWSTPDTSGGSGGTGGQSFDGSGGSGSVAPDASVADRFDGVVEGGEQRETTAPAEPWHDHREVWLLACLNLPAGLRYGYTLDPATRQPTALAAIRAVN